MIRPALLKLSESAWLREHAMRSRFLQRGVRRFLPGETLEAALKACEELAKANVSALLTRLGENVSTRDDARAVTCHYLSVLHHIRATRRDIEISVKLTQLGLDLDTEFCFANLSTLIEDGAPSGTIWIDMEQSEYVERTLYLFERARRLTSHVGVCVQAYLRRSAEDVERLISLGATVRLVKGAYNEPSQVAFPSKRHVNEHFFRLATRLLSPEARRSGVRAALATHDRGLINRIIARAAFEGLHPGDLEFQMLYGIERDEQRHLAQRGHHCRVLVSYGNFWFPWYMRRLAERPANLLFVLRNLFVA
jgi:proline dehydrogenase